MADPNGSERLRGLVDGPPLPALHVRAESRGVVDEGPERGERRRGTLPWTWLNWFGLVWTGLDWSELASRQRPMSSLLKNLCYAVK